jgi:hypothetical protein
VADADPQARFTSIGASTQTRTLSQAVAPSTYAGNILADGSRWVSVADQMLVTDGKLTIKLEGRAIIADAIRIQPLAGPAVGPKATITDLTTGKVLGGQQDTIDFGAMALGQSVTRRFRVANDGVLPLDLSSIRSEGFGFLVTQDLPQQLQPGQSAEFGLRFDAVAEGPMRSGVNYGTNSPTNGLIRMELRANVLAEQWVRTQDTDQFLTRKGFTLSTTTGFSSRVATSSSEGAYATWSFDDLEPGTYAVYTTWAASLATANASDSVPYRVYEDPVGDGVTVRVDQSKPVGGVTFDDKTPWRLLTLWDVQGDSLSVTLRNETAGKLAQADAIRLVRLYHTMPQFTLDDVATESGTSVDFGTVSQGEMVFRKISVTNPSPTPLRLFGIDSVPMGYAIRGFEPQYLAQGESHEFELILTGQQHGQWSGRLGILTSDPVNSVFELNLSAAVISPTTIVMHSDPSFSVTAGSTAFPISNLAGSFRGHGRLNSLGAAGSAQWGLTNLEPGVYRVSTTWDVATNRAKAAAFSVTAGGQTRNTTWDQSLALASQSGAFWDHHQLWVDLASEIEVGSDGRMTVVASRGNAAGQVLSVNALRLERLRSATAGFPEVRLSTTTASISATAAASEIRRVDFASGSATLYSAGSGQGFVTTAPSVINRGTISGSPSDAWSRFAAQDTAARTLRLDLPAGDYTVTLWGGSATSGGRLRQQSYDVTLAQAGALNVALSASAGQSQWSLSAIDVRSRESVVWRELVSGASTDRADGTTIDSFVADGLPSGIYTVSTTQGTVTTADADAALQGQQVVVGSDGVLSVTLQRPSSAAVAKLVARHDQGAAIATGEFSYTQGTAVDRKFDFGTATSAAQAGYQAVGVANQAYSRTQGWGWLQSIEGVLVEDTVATRYGTVATTNGLLALPTTGDRGVRAQTGMSDLLRDVHSTNVARVFRTDLANGHYTVTATLGDTSARTGMAIRVLDGSGAGVDNVATAANEYRRVSFDAQVTDGVLRLEFSATGSGTTWSVAGLEIRNRVAAQRLAAVGPLDGFRQHAVSLNLPAGAYTLSSTLGAVTGTDGDARVGNLQLTVAAGNLLNFGVRHDGSGSGEVTIESLDGTRRYTLPISYRIPELRRYDFNSVATGATLSGFEATLPSKLYTADTGFGWLSAAAGTARTTANTTPVALFQDSHSGTAARTFQLAVEPWKGYDLRLYLGDLLQRMSAEISIEGEPWETVETAIGQHTTWTRYVVPTGPTLQFTIRQKTQPTGVPLTSWYINGLELADAGKLPSGPTAASIRSVPDMVQPALPVAKPSVPSIPQPMPFGAPTSPTTDPTLYSGSSVAQLHDAAFAGLGLQGEGEAGSSDGKSWDPAVVDSLFRGL